MKIEMGESLIYSWLRHVKDCQIVQTNWKTTSQWNLLHLMELEQIKEETATYFHDKYGYNIYKKSASLSQILQQGESDVIGISFSSKAITTYAVDVAFHEGGLGYGSKDETIMKIVNKCIRTAMCLYGYMDVRNAQIIFASPKINKAVLSIAEPCISEAQKILRNLGYEFTFRIIANESFKTAILDPILMLSDDIADTGELFLRSYQMLQMFDEGADKVSIEKRQGPDSFNEMKIGKLAQAMIPKLLQSGKVPDDEIERMFTLEYSKETFTLTYPVLAKVDERYESERYYVTPIQVKGKSCVLCSQWFENDRPYLDKWIAKHQLNIGTVESHYHHDYT